MTAGPDLLVWRAPSGEDDAAVARGGAAAALRLPDEGDEGDARHVAWRPDGGALNFVTKARSALLTLPAVWAAGSGEDAEAERCELGC